MPLAFSPHPVPLPPPLLLPHGLGAMDFSCTRIMGVLNVTPDSFSDGGKFLDHEAALSHALTMVKEGADLIDVGGESARPGSRPVSLEQERERVIPVIRALAANAPQVVVSIDTTKAQIALEAIEAGAHIVNDISAGLFDPEMFGVIASLGVPCILMHTTGRPEVMQSRTDYEVGGGLKAFFAKRLAQAAEAGIPAAQTVLDPGIGFGKTVAQNCRILAAVSEFLGYGCAVLVGTSRKGFLGKLLALEPGGGVRAVEERQWGSVVSMAAAVMGGAHMVRVHEVAASRDALRIVDAIRGQEGFLRT